MSLWTKFRDKVLRPVAAVAAQSNPWTAPLARLIQPKAKSKSDSSKSRVQGGAQALVPINPSGNFGVTPQNPKSRLVEGLLDLLVGDSRRALEESLVGDLVKIIAKDKADYDYREMYHSEGRNTPEEAAKLVAERGHGKSRRRMDVSNETRISRRNKGRRGKGRKRIK